MQASMSQRHRRKTVSGVGLLTSAIAANIGDGKQFKSGRECAARLGLMRSNRSSGNKVCRGNIHDGNLLPAISDINGGTKQTRIAKQMR